MASRNRPARPRPSRIVDLHDLNPDSLCTALEQQAAEVNPPARRAIRDVFGDARVQRCIRHKERNVLEHLPERDRAVVKRRLREAWALDDRDQALDRLQALGAELIEAGKTRVRRAGAEVVAGVHAI